MAEPTVQRRIRFRDLKARGISDSYAQLDRQIKLYSFPPGRMLSPNIRSWTEQEVATWIETRPSDRKTMPPTARRPGRPRKHEAKQAA
jgi:predicted DNA-binding transcriptional regulator AlpA